MTVSLRTQGPSGSTWTHVVIETPPLLQSQQGRLVRCSVCPQGLGDVRGARGGGGGG